MKVDLDHSRIRRDFNVVKTAIPRRRRAFNDQRQLEFIGGFFNRSNKIKIILGRARGWHEHMQCAVAGFDAHGSVRNPIGRFQ